MPPGLVCDWVWHLEEPYQKGRECEWRARVPAHPNCGAALVRLLQHAMTIHKASGSVKFSDPVFCSEPAREHSGTRPC